MKQGRVALLCDEGFSPIPVESVIQPASAPAAGVGRVGTAVPLVTGRDFSVHTLHSRTCRIYGPFSGTPPPQSPALGGFCNAATQQQPSQSDFSPLSPFRGSLLESLRGFLVVLTNQRPVAQESFAASFSELSELVSSGKTATDSIQTLKPGFAKRSGGDFNNFITFGAPTTSQKRQKH